MSDGSSSFDPLVSGLPTKKREKTMNQEHYELIKKSVTDLTEMERRQAFINEIMKQAARVQGIYTDAMEKAGKQPKRTLKRKRHLLTLKKLEITQKKQKTLLKRKRL